MDAKHLDQKKIKFDILKIVGKYLDLQEYKVFFFGSRVKGTSTPHSDIDIGIEGPAEVPAEKFLSIKEDIENLPILYKFDVVDFKSVGDKLHQEAKKNIEYLN